MSVGFQNFHTKYQTGFTLLEVLVSIAIMGLVIGYFVNYRVEQMKVQLGENIAQDVMLITNSATNFYVANAVGRTWPGQSSTPACGDAITRLQPDYLPSGFIYNPASTITTSCSGGVADSFDIMIEFPLADADLARIVKTALPSAVELPVSGGATTRQVVQRVFPPRRTGRQYYFHKEKLSSGTISILKPGCAPGANPVYVAVPQTICVHDSNGLQGYYFREPPGAAPSASWSLTLCAGTLNTGGAPDTCNIGGGSSPIRYRRHSDTCDGQDVWVGVVTYCE